MVRWTASPFAALIDVVGLQEIELAFNYSYYTTNYLILAPQM